MTHSFKVGDKVVIESNIPRGGDEGALGASIIGRTYTVSAVRADCVVAGFDLAPESFLKVDDLDAIAAERAPFKVGDKVRLVTPQVVYPNARGRNYPEAAQGDTGEVIGAGALSAAVHVRWDADRSGSYVWPGALERIVEPPVFAIGDRVVVTSPVWTTRGETRDYFLSDAILGDTGEVVGDVDSDGDYDVKIDRTGLDECVSRYGLALAPVEPEPEPFKVGDRVRYSSTFWSAEKNRNGTGVVTAVNDDEDGLGVRRYDVRQDVRAGGYVSVFDYSADELTLIEPESAFKVGDEVVLVSSPYGGAWAKTGAHGIVKSLVGDVDRYDYRVECFDPTGEESVRQTLGFAESQLALYVAPEPDVKDDGLAEWEKELLGLVDHEDLDDDEKAAVEAQDAEGRIEWTVETKARIHALREARAVLSEGVGASHISPAAIVDAARFLMGETA